MISNKSLLCILVILVSATNSLRADDDTEVNSFCEHARSEFNSLLRQCKKDRADYWTRRQDESIGRYIAKSRELQKTSELLKKEPNSKELQQVFAFDYLNQIHELQLEDATRLVEDLGRELLNERSNAELMPRIRQVEAQFLGLQGKPQSDTVQSSYREFLELQRRAAQLEISTPVESTFTFQPKANAYSSEPLKTIIFTLHDWNAGLAKVDALEQELRPIEDNLATARLFTPKDPIAWLPVATQLSVLLVGMAGWTKAYHSEKAFRAIGAFVGLSMAASIFLVFYSPATFLNIVCQSIIPGCFILYWIGKNNNWSRWTKFRAAKKHA